MTLIYIEPDSLKELSNKELIKRYYRISQIESNAQYKSTPPHLIEQIRQMYALYENEVERRVDEDIFDEDEVEELWEYYEDKDDSSWEPNY